MTDSELSIASDADITYAIQAMKPTLVPAIMLSFGFANTSAAADVREVSAPANSPIVIESFQVREAYVPKLSFGLSLDLWKDNRTNKIASITVRSVREGSDAELKGIVPFAKIYRIDGRPVDEIECSFIKGTMLKALFVNRRNGDEIVLEVGLPGETATHTLTLIERQSSAQVWGTLTHP